MAAPVQTGAVFTPGAPQPLFQTRFAAIASSPGYAPSADGRRFLIATPVEEAGPPAPITVVLNWQR